MTATSMFTQLLDSYAGIRQRSWTPLLLEGEFEGTYRNLFGPGGWKATGIAGPQYKAMLQQMKGAVSQAAQAPIKPDQWQQQKLSASPGTIQGLTTGQIGIKGPGNNEGIFGKKTIPTVIAAIDYYMGLTDEEEDDAADKKLGQEQDKEVEDGVNTDADEEEKRKEEFKTQAAALEKQEHVSFSEPQVKSLTKFFENKKMGPKEVAKQIAKLEKTINTPHKGTKYYAGMVDCMGSRPDMPRKVKQQAIKCIAAICSMANKVENAKLADGSLAPAIREEDLTTIERAARRIVTVRGEGGTGGVFFGKSNIDREDDFTDLQDFTSDYDNSTYGTTFGKALGDGIGALWGVRFLPTGTNASLIPDRETFDKKDHSTRQSTSVEKNQGSGKNLSNDWKGKLTEDIVELNVAYIAGDKAAIKTALEHLKKRLKAGAVFAEADLDNLESALMGDEYIGLLDFQRLEALGIPPNVQVRQAILQAAVQTEVFFTRVGISQANIVGVGRPSQGSIQGYKSDVDIYLDPKALETITPEFRDCLFTDEKGRLVLNISIKNYAELQGETVMGSSSTNKTYGTNVGHRAKFNQLQAAHIQRAKVAGSMDDADEKDCIEALTYDRDQRETLEALFGSFINPNKAVMSSYLKNLLNPKALGDHKFTSLEGRKKYEDTVNSIIKDLNDGKKGPQFAVQKIWQMDRLAKSQSNPRYARGAAFNDAISSAGTFENESVLRGSPGKLTTGTYHSIFNGLASSLFGKKTSPTRKPGKAVFTLSASTIYHADGTKIGVTRLTAKKTESGRKNMSEFKLQNEGRKKYTRTESAHVGQLKAASDIESALNAVFGTDAEDGEAAEPLTGSTLFPILQQLPDKATGQIQKVGDKLIVSHHPFCLKVKCMGQEFEGGFPSKEKALKALDMIRQLAQEAGDSIDAKVEDYDAGRTLS